LDKNQGVVGFQVKLFEDLVLVWHGDGPAPRQVIHRGRTFHRFMDIFFVSHLELDELSLEEVVALCRARESYSSSIGQANESVKGLFRRAVAKVTPERVVEIGAGARPLYDGRGESFDYIALDADMEAMSKLSSRKESFCARNGELDLPAASVDIVVAVFVFQFRIYDIQIKEISRILKRDGILLVNVYRRSEESRARLASDLESSGLHVQRVNDPQELCCDHEYWVASKSQTSVCEFRDVLCSQF